MQTVIGRVAMPGLERAVPADGLELEHQEEQDRAERGVHQQGHHVGGAEGRGCEKMPSGSIGCRSRRSATTKATPASDPASAAHGASGPPHSMSA